MARDIVCDMQVVSKDASAKGLQAVYLDHTFLFCSESCKQMFLEDPQRYVSNKAIDLYGFPVGDEMPDDVLIRPDEPSMAGVPFN